MVAGRAWLPQDRGSEGQPGSSSGKQDGLGALELLGLPIEHHDITVTQHRVAARLASQDPLAANAGEGHADTAAAHVAQRPSHRPGSRWDDHGFDLFAVLVTFVERARVTPADDVSQDGVTVAADVTH